MLNLISRIIELAVERALALIDRDRVEQKVVDLLVADGIDYRDLSAHFDASEVASHIEVDYSELAGELDTSDIASEIMDDYRFQNRMEDHIRDAVEGEVETRIAALERKVEGLIEDKANEPTPEAATTIPEVSATLTDRLLALAVERLLAAADEAVRDGKV